MRINNIQNTSFGKIYKVTSNTKNPNDKMVNPDVFTAVMDARGTISGLRKKDAKDEPVSRELGEFLKAQIVDWDGSVDGLALKHIGDSDYLFTGDDAKKFFQYKMESRKITPETELAEKTEEFLKNLRRSKNILQKKVKDYDQEIDTIGLMPASCDEQRKKYLKEKRAQYNGHLKVVQNHIDSVEGYLKEYKSLYRVMYATAKQETMVESGDFDEIAFRFSEYGEINSVEFLEKSQAKQAQAKQAQAGQTEAE